MLPRVARGIPRRISDERPQLALDSAPSDMRVILALAAFAGLRAIEIA